MEGKKRENEMGLVSTANFSCLYPTLFGSVFACQSLFFKGENKKMRLVRCVFSFLCFLGTKHLPPYFA